MNISKYKWLILVLLVIGSLINYIDRSALSIAAPYIMKEFNFSAADMGNIFSGFFFTYAVFCFIGGYCSDLFGPKRTMGIAMIFWSFFAFAPAIAWGFASLFVFRLLFGASEGPISSVSNKMITNWFSPTERARAKGISDSGMSLGAAISGPMVGLIAIKWGWRVSFIVLLVLGLLWTISWFILSYDTPFDFLRHFKKSHNTSVNGNTVEGEKKKSADLVNRKTLSFYLRQPIIWSIIISFFAVNFMTYFFMTWFPSYLVMERHLSIKNMSVVNVIPWLFGMLGYVLGGTLSDYVVKRTGNTIKSRKLVIFFSLIGLGISVGLCGLANSTMLAIILMSFGVFFGYLATPSFWASIGDSVKSSNVGGVGGFAHFLSNTAGIVAPSITGYIVQGTGKFTSAFILAGSLALLSALVVLAFMHPIRKLDEKKISV